MTTIAWDGTTLAADKQITEGSRACGLMTKIGRLGPDKLWALTGPASVGMQVVGWLEGVRPKPDPWPEKAEVFIIHRDGQVEGYENCATPYPQDPGPFTAGSGGPVAHGAMLAGSDAYVAVALASMVDIYTGGGIDTLTFEVQPGEG